MKTTEIKTMAFKFEFYAKELKIEAITNDKTLEYVIRKKIEKEINELINTIDYRINNDSLIKIIYLGNNCVNIGVDVFTYGEFLHKNKVTTLTF